MRATCLAIGLAMLPLGGTAAEPGPQLDAAGFDAATVGRTLYYNSGGEPYGMEQYLPGRRVVWAFLGDDCRKGFWYEQADDICFVYEDNPTPQCWAFFMSESGLLAQFRGDTDSPPLIAVEDSPEPMACLGPNIGV